MRPIAPLVLAAVLAGCAAQPASPVVEPSTTRNPLRPSPAQLDAFVAAFGEQYPELAEGRSSRSIAYDADNVCLRLREGADPAVQVRQMPQRFEYDPDDYSSKAILKLIRAKACPDA